MRLRNVARNATANVAWLDATNPRLSMSFTAQIGGSRDLLTRDDVERKFGAEAARAWHAAIDARAAFFDAVDAGATDA